jgi:hypothetical protein
LNRVHKVPSKNMGKESRKQHGAGEAGDRQPSLAIPRRPPRKFQPEKLIAAAKL